MSFPSSSRLSAPPKSLGTGGVFVAAVALVVSASTLVSDFTGFVRLGYGFVVAVALGLLVLIPVVISTCDLAVGSPRAGGIYRFSRSVIGGKRGRTTGYYLALLFTGTFLFGAAGETVAGAHALRSLVGDELTLGWGITVVALVGIVPNLFGLRCATRVTGALLVVMLGLRWFFGLAGFFGWGATGEWDAAHLVPDAGATPWSFTGAVTQGLALGFWCFVGIEGACSLAAETHRPERSLPRGLIFALLAIFATTLVTGLGALGGQPLTVWREAIAGAAGVGGEAPHLAVGEAMFGPTGRILMAIATLASTASTLLVAFAAMPRMIQALARDRLFPGLFASALARSAPATGAPQNATLALGGIYLVVTLTWGAVVDCLYAAAYLWFVRHGVLHGLAFWNRWQTNQTNGAFRRGLVLGNACTGLAFTGLSFAVSFAGVHAYYGSRALSVAMGAAVVAAASSAARRMAAKRRQERSAEHRLLRGASPVMRRDSIADSLPAKA